MAREEERRLKALRGRVVLWLSVFIVVVVVLMYLVVKPFMSAYGLKLDLPDGRVVFTLLAMAATGLLLIDGRQLAGIFGFLSNVRITFGGDAGKPPRPGGTPDAE